MKLITLLAAALAGVGCATTMTERIVHEAMKGFVYNAEYAPLPGGNPADLAALHAHLTTILDINVEYLPADDEAIHGAFGIAYTAGPLRFIKVREDLSVNGTIEVLAHEAAHLYQPPTLTRSEGDIFAEIVGAHVSARLGVPHAVTTAAEWLQQHKPRLRMALDLEREIQYVAGLLTPAR